MYDKTQEFVATWLERAAQESETGKEGNCYSPELWTRKLGTWGGL